MKRGFLNQPKAQKIEPPTKASENNDQNSEPEIPSRNSTHKKSFLGIRKVPNFLKLGISGGLWPRDPNGPPLIGGIPIGKMTSNELPLWGETPFDFFYVPRVPEADSVTVLTSSRISAWARTVGEAECTASHQYMEWADREGEPIQQFPCDIGRLIADREQLFGTTRTYLEASQKFERSESPKSIFREDGSSQSQFANPFAMPVPKLQKRVPLHLLPQKLVVHDPKNLLFVKSPPEGPTEDETTKSEKRSALNTPIFEYGDPKRMKWAEEKDIERVYNLELSSAGRDLREEKMQAEREADSREKSSESTAGFILKIEGEISGEKPTVFMVVYPPRPPPPTVTPEAHLYLSPDHEAGQGNHSTVYRAELKLPRSMLVEDQMCQRCALESALKKFGEGDFTAFDPLGGAQHIIVGFTHVQLESDVPDHEVQPKYVAPESEKETPEVLFQFTTEAQSEAKSSKCSTSSQESNQNYGASTTLASEEPRTDSDANKTATGESEETIPTGYYTVESAEDIHIYTHAKPMHRIYPDVKWQNPEREPYCKHLQRTKEIPLTAKVSVAAKLSIQHDLHLELEARNYQSFPTHLFEHWNGYNIVPPIHVPVPVGAVVPNFYGYYTPEKSIVDNEGDAQYLSPILLVEDCGVPVEPQALNQDEKNECASLVHRFHSSHWVHGSVAERNILVQPGPLTKWPLYRIFSNTKSFRLIDFGRSSNEIDSEAMYQESQRAEELFPNAFSHSTLFGHG